MLEAQQLFQYTGQAAVIVCAICLAGRNILSLRELLVMMSIIVLSLMVLDQFAPGVAQGMRHGTGFTMGYSITDGFDDGLGGEQDGESGEAEDSDESSAHPEIPVPANLMPRRSAYKGVSYASPELVGELPPILHPHLDRAGDDYKIFVKDAQREHERRVEGFQATPGGPIVGQTAAELGLVFGQAPITEQGHSSRARVFLYSGDLIDLKTRNGQSLLLPDNGRFVTLSSSGLLNKLRAVLSSGHVNHSLKPIRYGDAFRLTYNDSRGETKHLSHQQWLQPAVSKRHQLFKFVNPLDKKSTGPVQLGDIVAVSQITETDDPVMLIFDEASGRISTQGHLKDAVQFQVNAVRGCGPMWRFDSDTRGTNLKNPQQVKTIVERETQQVKQQLKEMEEEYGKLSAKCKLQCQQEILKAKHAQGAGTSPSPQTIASQGQLSALQQQVQSLKNNLSVLKQYKKLLEHRYPPEQECTAKGCGYNYKYDGQCVIGANDQQECDQIAAQDCHQGKKLTWVAEGRGHCRVSPK